MQKFSITAAACIALAAGFAAAPAPAEAGPFDGIKKAVKKVEKKKNEVEEVVETVERVRRGGSTRSSGGFANRGVQRGPRTARAPGHAGGAGATPAKYKQMTQCANVGLGNAFVARDGNYTFSQGISTEERSGLLDRRNVTPTGGCLFEGLGIGDVLYVEFDKAKYQKHSYKIQCVSFDGSEQQDNVHGPSVGNYGGKAVMLHTGNSAGYTPTASGSNSDRSNAYKTYMDKRGRTFTTFNFKGLHTDKSGTDFYCQWFDSKTGKSALALTYRRGPTG